MAAIIMQKWFRGWQTRKIYSKRIKRTKREIEAEYQDFADTFKANDSFNLNRFLKEKQRLRAQNGTDAMMEDDSISEHLGE
jgi:competence CoiA-like predicted nuclease